MTDPTTNDNDRVRAADPPHWPDAHGEAALLLVESLLCALVEKAVVTNADAVGIVETAVEVSVDQAVDRGEPRTATVLLSAIQRTLTTDLSP